MSDPRDFESAGTGLRHYLDVIRRRKWVVISITAVCVAAALVLSLTQKPVYRAATKIVIGQGGGLVQPGFANSIQPYTATMSDLISSDIVAKNVIDSLQLEMTPHELLSKISTSINPQTAVVDVYVDDHDKTQAVRIDQQVATVFSRLVTDRFGRASAASGTTQPLSANVFDPAHALPGRVSPRPARNIAVALVLGLILGLVAAFLREHFDRGLRTREDVESAFGLPVIGQVPFPTKGKEERRVAFEGRGETAEAFRGLRANLQYLAVQRPLRTILITSASPEQGKTTVTANLAVTIARSGASVVVVDADLRRPRLEATFGVDARGVGLTSVLVGAAELAEVLRDVELPQDARREAGRLAFVPSGPLPPNPSELLTSAQMTALLDRLSATFDYVLVDSPPVLLVADALELARDVDGVVLVVRRGSASTDEARELRATVDRLGIHLVGAVFTDVDPVRSYGSYGESSPPPPSGGRRRRRAEAQPEPAAAASGPASEEVF
jgi:capsular exopolysaccharide synthesis family protein